MKHVAGEDLSKYQAALDYINWWHSGEPGAIAMRQGYYNVVQETSREFVEPFEWDYWIDGKPADQPIPNLLRRRRQAFRSAPSATAVPSSTVRACTACGTRSWTSSSTKCNAGTSSWRPS